MAERAAYAALLPELPAALAGPSFLHFEISMNADAREVTNWQ